MAAGAAGRRRRWAAGSVGRGLPATGSDARCQTGAAVQATALVGAPAKTVATDLQGAEQQMNRQ